jgi:hypothetical protein
MRGLRLEVDVAARLGRLLLVLAVASVLTVLRGASSAAPQVRRHHEILRTQPRHGTQLRLSALTVGILLLSRVEDARLAARVLRHILDTLQRGVPAHALAARHAPAP